MTVYLDHNATTPLEERVLEAMLPFLREHYGNPSSRHELGTVARRAIGTAREQVAALVGAQAAQVIFTGSGTEANNLFIRGAAGVLKPAQVAVSAVEHSCVMKPARELARQGWSLRKLAVDAGGQVDLSDVQRALATPTGIVSVMLANNETGVVNDVAAVAQTARAAGCWMHSDAVQAAGKMPVDFSALGVHALSLSAHKLYGPKGVGALVLDKRIELRPQLTGGGHEGGMRAGTENVAGIVGFGAACELAGQRLDALPRQLLELRERLESGLVPMQAQVFGQASPRLPNTTYFAIHGIDGEALVIALDRAGFAVSSGSACSSAGGAGEPSPVLLAMGVEPALARGAVRVSLGAGNTARQVDDFLAALHQVVDEFRRLSAFAV